MAYVRDGYVVMAKHKKIGYGQTNYVIGKGKRFINVGRLIFPDKYDNETVRLKVEVLKDEKKE